MRIYIDNDFKCHTSNNGTMQEVETDFFDGKCTKYIEGYRFVPSDETWTRSDGTVFQGEMISPWKDYSILAAYQEAYDEAKAEVENIQEEYDSMIVDYEYQLAALTPAPMALDLEPMENQNANEKLYNALKRIIYRRQIDSLEEKLNVFLAVGKLTEEWYIELLNLINSETNNN